MGLAMTISCEFEYIKPQSIAEAVKALAASKNGKVIAGGTDLVCWLHEDLIGPDVLVDIKGLDELKKIEFKNNVLSIGALVTFSEIIESKIIKEKFPILIEASKMVASCGVRNRATMAGNICSAVSSCDSGPALLVYEAEVVVHGKNGERKIPIEKWFVGPKTTSIKSDEFVTYILLKYPNKKFGSCYVKHGRYKGEDLAQSSVAVLLIEGNIYRIAFGAVAPTPIRAKKIETILNGNSLDDILIEKCCELVSSEITPITDIRSSKEYRTHMIKVMLDRALVAVKARFDGKEESFGGNLVG